MSRCCKITLGCVSLLLALAFPVAHAADGLLAHYAFDEGAGTVLRDGSGQGHDGTIVGGAAWTTGPFGTALKLNGTDAYVD